MSTLQTCTSSTRPAHAAGEIAYETDTTRTIISDGSYWHLYMPDLFSRATCAFSLRQIVPDYTGNCVKVRRSSDNVELDIGFTDTGVIDQAALLVHTGTGAADAGYVVTWYDQGPFSMDATNTTAAQQPTIVSAGAVVVSNSKPSILFGGATILEQPLWVTATPSSAVWKIEPPTHFASVAVCELTDVTDTALTKNGGVLAGQLYCGYFNASGAGGLGEGIGAAGDLATGSGGMRFKRISSYLADGVGLWDTTTLASLTQAIGWFDYNGTKTVISTNGDSEQDTTDVPNPWSSGTAQNIGALVSSCSPWEGKISEWAIYHVDRTSEKAAILANVNGFYGTY